MTKDEWKQTVNDWRTSGQSQIDFCKQRNLNPSSFYNHKSKLEPKAKKKTTKSDFVALSVTKSAANQSHKLDLETVALLLRAFDKVR